MKIIDLFETQLLEEYTETIACGECFAYGFREVIGNENTILVHALVTHPFKGNKYPHAWIEDKNLVKDWQTMEMGASKYAKVGWPIAEFYDVWKPEDVVKYTATEAMAEYRKNKHTGPWKDFIYENVVPFRPKDTRPDQMKYNDALEDQTGDRADLGIIPCPYCDDEWCNFDCDEAQAEGFESEDKLYEGYSFGNYLDLDILKKFQLVKYGMINLQGDLYPVGFYDHLELFEKKPLIPEVQEMLLDLKERLADAEEQHLESIPDGEHPEWHAYEMYADSESEDVKSKAMKIIYKNGWGRLGTIGHGFDSNTLELECLFDYQETLEKYSRELAEMLNLEFTINVITTLR